MNNPIIALTESLSHATYVGFPEIEYETRDWEAYNSWKSDLFKRGISIPVDPPPECYIKLTRRPSLNDIGVIGMFEQAWGSTALGFGGVGGQAITNAYTVVLECNGQYNVYFAGMFAYSLINPNIHFWQDLAGRSMKHVKGHKIYEQ